ncbi:MAG: mechanosensitive ion channel family protein [Sulfurovum sp.]|uniref:mechanosensitive ion channel family protein n=1 Tax=Sulfurovum sp. TaxID=1969726 RepID=UPI002867B3E7|nr:mechanosensitive ion channel family protein [Sulfurovum sp.]MCO4845838.1 mechanosensitive ion channel family protein [Sulfurovum sp.]
MPTTEVNTTDLNATLQLNVIDDISMNLEETVQTLLIPVYEKYPILANTFLDIPLANLFAAILVFLLFLLFRKLFTLIVMGTLQKVSKVTDTYHDDKVISALKDPVSFAFILVGAHLFFVLIFKETELIKNILNTLVVYTIFWAILSVMESLRGVFHHATEKFNPDLAKEMGNFILKIVKFLVGALGLGAMLQVWGINVTALVASLGLGGLAFALAAKDTASNMFGSFALLADKSIRIGEWIKVGGVEGTVEDIGMRTTKIRSFEKSLITVPNQIVSNSPIENFSRRGVRRIKMSIGVTYGTTADQMNAIVQEIRDMLHNHENISHKDTLLVNFESFGDSSLNIFIYTFTNTSNWERYLNIREDIHLKIMKIVEENESAFAFPSQSIYLEQMPSETEHSV